MEIDWDILLAIIKIVVQSRKRNSPNAITIKMLTIFVVNSVKCFFKINKYSNRVLIIFITLKDISCKLRDSDES